MKRIGVAVALAVSIASPMESRAHDVTKKTTQQLQKDTIQRLEQLDNPKLEQTARDKIELLKQGIAAAKKAGIETLKEQMTLRTAEVFLKYANWDEAHTAENTAAFEAVAPYRVIASDVARMLPNFERSEVVVMLDEASETLRQLQVGEVTRKPIPNVDWADVTHDGDQLTFRKRPVFLADYTWKPEIPELTEFFGNQDGFFLMHAYVTNEKGEINKRILKELEQKPDGRMGFIFLNHKVVPAWAKQKYGPDFSIREDTYTAYDIDNPGAREINRMLLSATVPKMAGKKYTELGYMLCNEPHFYTTEDVWATGPVSDYTITKFKKWLAEKHASVSDLNALWGTNFSRFDDVTINIPISQSLQGTPQWYDWVSFNRDRVTDWYRFLKDEIRKYDPQAKVHLKVMPSLWTGNKRNHGIDMEALTQMSEIIGNDCGTHYNHMWGKSHRWESRYALEWTELCMAHDFYKSVSPEKIVYNTEAHYLSTVTSRDLFMDPAYARATYWLAHVHGMNASQTWYWSRLADGSIKNKSDNGYAASNNQQPRVVNEVASTMMDLNTFAEEITAMQRQRKPLRIFYSATSAINKDDHMDGVFDLYESICFDGVPIGFVTENILTEQDHRQWDGVLIYQTEFATRAEFNAIQSYLDKGGVVIIDSTSLKKDEYGRPLSSLQRSKGVLVEADSLERFQTLAKLLVAKRGLTPELIVDEVNGVGGKGCIWKCVKNSAGNNVLSIVNMGKTDAKLTIGSRHSASEVVCKDLINGVPTSANPTLKPFDVYFAEVASKSSDR